MDLFKFSKLQYLINFLKGNLSGFFLPLRLFNPRVDGKLKIPIFLFAFGFAFWVTICIPSMMNFFPFFTFEKGFKLSQGFHMSGYPRLEDCAETFRCRYINGLDVVFQIDNFIQESIPKSRSGFIEFFLPSPVFAEDVGTEGADKCRKEGNQTYSKSVKIHISGPIDVNLIIAAITSILAFCVGFVMWELRKEIGDLFRRFMH